MRNSQKIEMNSEDHTTYYTIYNNTLRLLHYYKLIKYNEYIYI